MRIILFVKDFLWFGLRQAQACLFGGILLALIVVTKFIWKPDFLLARYDFLFVSAIAVQAILIATRLETMEECKVILIFHIVGTIMEIFKTSVGSWAYPEASLIRIAGVPLFSGFMYSSVGSYIARAWRLFGFRFTHYPERRWMLLLCVLIYANFFTHHYMFDLRYALFVFIAVLFGRTWIFFRPRQRYYAMPLLLGFVLVAFFIWIAENFGTFGAIWIYPSQKASWHIVPVTKLGAWFLLMIISFSLVSLIHRRQDEVAKSALEG